MAYIYNTAGEKFTFEEGMINKISSDIATDVEQNVMPGLAPMANQGYDANGVEKIITIDGQLFDTNSSVTSTNNIQDKKIMKLWLEALENGAQEAVEFYSNYEEYSVSGAGTTTFTDSVSSATVNINATFEKTKVFIRKITFDEEAGDPEEIPFTMELWVGGY